MKYTGYTGADAVDRKGPPASVELLPRSDLEVGIELDKAVDELFWEGPGGDVPFSRVEDGLWRARTNIEGAGTYRILSRREADTRGQVVVEGDILTKEDNPPRVRFAADELNVEAWPGQTLPLEVEARDDFGVSEIQVTVGRSGDEGGEEETLLRRRFPGPPGRKQPEPVQHGVQLDPSRFSPGEEYMFRAVARDFHPDGQMARSRPLLVRVKGLDEMPEGDDLPGGLQALNEAIEQQQRALSNTRTVINYMDAVLGQDPDKPEFTFYNHRAQIQARQRRVDRLLEGLPDKTPEEMRRYAERATEIREELVNPLALGIERLAGDPVPWFGDVMPELEDREYEDEGGGWHAARVSPQTGRYLGLRMQAYHGQLAISDIQLIDGDGRPVPPPYVGRFRMSPVFDEWDGPVGFVELDAEKFDRIVSGALSEPLRGGSGRVVELNELPEDAPSGEVALYAVRVVQCKEPRRVLLHAGSSDSLRVWVNGRLKLKRLARRRPRPDADRVEVELTEGKNVVVAEVSAGDKPPALAMRFSDSEGHRLSLTEGGRLVRAPETKIVHAGGSPEQAGRVVDGDGQSRWRVTGEKPVLLVLDLGHRRQMSGVCVKVAGGTRNQGMGLGKYDLYVAEKLEIHRDLPPIVEDQEFWSLVRKAANSLAFNRHKPYTRQY